ncbi:MAG: hypothetical protein ICV65_03175 [Flavisolibacter sp.]|nr:hypothetical protein [Flavisolibacter sp.]
MKKQRQNRLADFEVDKLTKSIENASTGETFDTEIIRLTAKESKRITKADWQFDWKKELKDTRKEVYQLSTVDNPNVIHGLISMEDKGDHIFMHLVESAKFNKGKSKIYLGVPGNLVAFACKRSIEKGYDGYVAFDSKTVLIEHYNKTLGATHLGGQRMYIDDKAAVKLIEQYFKK